MVLVAIIAILLSAWMYNREHSSSQRAWTSTQLFALNDNDAKRRREAVENLYTVEQEDLARTVAALARALSDPDWRVRVAAARSLFQVIGSKNRSVTKEIDFATMALIPACRDPRDEVRIEAVRAVGELYDSIRISPPAPGAPAAKAVIGSVSRQAVVALLQAMQDPSPEVRAQAVWSFARVGRVCVEDAGPVKAMVEHDPGTKVRIAAVNALAKGWPEDEDPLLYPLLLARLKVVTNPEEHAAIGWALGCLAPPSQEILPALLDALSPDDWVLRQSIAVALGKLGPAARPALSTLARVARIELADPHSSLSAIHAIIAIDPKSPEALALIEPLIRLVRDAGSDFQQSEAVDILAGFCPSAAAVRALREALKSKNGAVRQRASFVLGRVGSAAVSAIPNLTTLARDDPVSIVKWQAADALKRINASALANSPPWPYPLSWP
jgi:HEAT repeat protein